MSTLLVFALVLSSVPMLCSMRISVGFFSQRPVSPRPLSHDVREVTPTQISTSPSLPQANNCTTASGRPRTISLSNASREAELDHRGDVLDSFLPLDIMLLSSVSKERLMHLNLSTSLALHRSTLAFMYSISKRRTPAARHGHVSLPCALASTHDAAKLSRG